MELCKVTIRTLTGTEINFTANYNFMHTEAPIKFCTFNPNKFHKSSHFVKIGYFTTFCETFTFYKSAT